MLLLRHETGDVFPSNDLSALHWVWLALVPEQNIQSREPHNESS